MSPISPVSGLNEDSAAPLRETETAFAGLTERMVQREAFAELLAWTTENVMGVTKLAFDLGDLVVRNLRLAGRADINRLGRQLARTEDKLELVLQELEALRAEHQAAAGLSEPDPTVS